MGCEFLLLLTGRLDLQHGEVTHHLEAGDAAYFDADTTHSYICVGDIAATAVIVTLQQPVTTPYTGGPRTGPAAGMASNRVRGQSPTLLRTHPTGGPQTRYGDRRDRAAGCRITDLGGSELGRRQIEKHTRYSRMIARANKTPGCSRTFFTNSLRRRS